jgi:prepilin-type N-terminal cleavage/methylation domain-containing protein
MTRRLRQSKQSKPDRYFKKRFRRSGFTLIELLVVISILAILGAITIGSLGNAAGRGKADTTRNIVGMLSGAIVEQYENYEDIAASTVRSASDVVALRGRIRQEMPDSWEDVAPGANVPTASFAASRAYAAYKASKGTNKPTSAYAGAECLYMIITQSGMFPDFLSGMPSKFIGDIDRDGAFEFLDGWGRPISFIRWAPGAMPNDRRVPAKYPDPLDPYSVDTTAFALVPLIFSPGKDESLNDPNSGAASGYGLLSRGLNGWPDASLAVSGTTPCTYNPDGKGLIGAPDPENADAYRDNISNYDTLFQ